MGDEQRRLPPGVLVRLSFPFGDLLAPIFHDTRGEFTTCTKCGVIPEFFYKLECPHCICSNCIASTRSSYTCGTDGTRTEIPLPIRVPPTRNAQLKLAAVNCPGCNQPFMFEYIKAHINQNHPDLWKQGKPATKMETQVYGGYNARDHGSPAIQIYPSCGVEDQTKAARNFGTSNVPHYGNQQPVAELPPVQYKNQAGPPISVANRQLDEHHAAPRHSSAQRTIKSDEAATQRNYTEDTGYPHAHQGDKWGLEFSVQQASTRDESAAKNEPAEEYMAAVSRGGQHGHTFDIPPHAAALPPQGYENHGGTPVLREAIPSQGPNETGFNFSQPTLTPPPPGFNIQGGTAGTRGNIPPSRPQAHDFDNSRDTPQLLHQKYTNNYRTWVSRSVQHQEALRATFFQQTCKDNEPAAPIDSTDVHMEDTESSGQPPPKAVIADTREQIADASNTMACKYCFKAYEVEKREEHVNMCPTLLSKGWELFAAEIFKHYQTLVSSGDQGSEQSTKTFSDHINDGLFSWPEFKKLIRCLVVECYDEHLSKHGQGEHDVLANIEVQEHIRTCPTFTSKCAEFWAQVMLGHDKPIENIGCPTDEQGCQSFQEKKVGNSSESPGGDDDERRKKEHLSTEECPYCSEKWEVEEFVDHLTSCEEQYVNCRQCAIKVHKDYYQQHLNQKCLDKEQVGNHVKKAQECNGRGAGEKDDIEDLKKKVENLEGRIRALEQPLKRLIERLQKESHATKT